CSGDIPVGDTPRARSARVERQANVDRDGLQVIETHRHGHWDATTPAGPHGLVRRHTDVVELSLRESEAQAAPHDGAAALEFVDRDVHAGPVERRQSALQTFAGHESREVAVLTARVREQRAIGTACMAVHRRVDEREKVGRSLAPPLVERGARLLELYAPAQESWDLCDQ